MNILNINEGQFADLIEQYKSDVEQIKNQIIPTNFKSIDKIIKGFTAGELIVVGGRPAMGKTAFLLSLARNMSVNNTVNPTLYVCLEQSVSQITGRLINVLDYEEYNKDAPLYFINSKWNLDSIISDIERYVAEKQVKIVFIDYIQLIQSENNKYRDLDLSTTLSRLKQLAIENALTIILASQLNRNIEYRGGDRKPLLSDLRDSGSLEQITNKVMFIHRPEYYGITMDINGYSTLNTAEIIIAKNNNGKIGSAIIEFDKEKSRFNNINTDNLNFGDIDVEIAF